MMSANSFTPDWVSPPGETLLDLLEEHSWSRIDLANGLQWTAAAIDRLISGDIEMTSEIASALERLFSVPANFWLSRERQFREEILRLDASNKPVEWLTSLPWKEMVKFGWISPSDRSEEAVNRACLEFFGVPDLAAWARRYANADSLVAFRRSSSFNSNADAVIAWLRQGEIIAARSRCAKWDPEKLYASLPKMRGLSRISAPEKFLPELSALAAKCGVSIAIVRSLSGCPVSGAARFISPDHALVQLSFRYLSDDHFWFTLFHEIAHLLLHGRTTLHLEGVAAISPKEEVEANEFSGNLLIPTEEREALKSLPLDSKTIIRYAVRLGISPGIVVGQMQHAKLLTRKQMNGLKRRYRWS